MKTHSPYPKTLARRGVWQVLGLKEGLVGKTMFVIARLAIRRWSFSFSSGCRGAVGFPALV